MSKKNFFNETLNESIINIAYNSKYYSILKDPVFNFDILIEMQNNNYINILNAIENIPDCFTSTSNNIKNMVDMYIKSIDKVDYYKNENFYKTGFLDGYKFSQELQKQKKEENTNE